MIPCIGLPDDKRREIKDWLGVTLPNIIIGNTFISKPGQFESRCSVMSSFQLKFLLRKKVSETVSDTTLMKEKLSFL